MPYQSQAKRRAKRRAAWFAAQAREETAAANHVDDGMRVVELSDGDISGADTNAGIKDQNAAANAEPTKTPAAASNPGAIVALGIIETLIERVVEDGMENLSCRVAALEAGWNCPPTSAADSAQQSNNLTSRLAALTALLSLDLRVTNLEARISRQTK